MFRIVWTDPRTGAEYLIQAPSENQAESQGPTTQYLVRKLNTGELVSFFHESPEQIQSAVAKLVDEAERLLDHRSKRRRKRALWISGKSVVGTVAERAKRLRWKTRP